jgi:hypothetical protein
MLLGMRCVHRFQRLLVAAAAVASASPPRKKTMFARA